MFLKKFMQRLGRFPADCGLTTSDYFGHELLYSAGLERIISNVFPEFARNSEGDYRGGI